MGREEKVVVDQERPVIHFDKNILTIVVEEVPRDARALRHPVQPEAPIGVIDVVPADLNVNGAVKLDARHLRAAEQLTDMDVMYGVARDGAERSAQAADNPGLLAVRDGVVADNVVADVFL